ncbi:acyl-CoA-binding domain-containing protein 5 isoform X9 [Equus caballus]|uniref:acyl-CoA-binding domain-containing protein 5 isoform X9 n=1 Tax=Equus caballus TaxID=9796 RepID=UPI0038B252F5
MLFLSFHAGSWESWCCCCLIPADTPGDRGRRWRLEMADTRSVHETRFEAAVKVIQSLPKNDLGNVLTSTPNAKTINGKAESSDSGAESEEEEAQEEVKGAEQSDNDKKMMKKSSDHKNLEIVVTNGYEKDNLVQDVQNDIHAPSSLNGRSAEEVQPVDPNLEPTGETTVCVHQDINDEHIEDVSGIQHLTSDSDSEVYCDSMEQFGQEESLDSITSNNGPFRYYLGGDPNHPLENSGFPEAVQLSPGNGNVGDVQVAAVEGKGEVKHGGEDGGSNTGAPHREKRGGENEEFSNVRRGRGHRMQHLSEGAKGRQVGSGGDGERWGSDRGSRGTLNEQIALVLMRLQEDMQNVLQRLHKLETLTASQAKSSTLQTRKQPPSQLGDQRILFSQRPSWWPFEMSPGTLAFAIIWPFIAQWLVHLYYQRRRRKLN